MTKTPLKWAFLAVLVALTGFSAEAKPGKPAFGKADIIIHTEAGIQHFSVETATTPEAMERGLMFRRKLPRRHGMLFLFKHENLVHFWMKNTYIPLDIIFIGYNGEIRKIADHQKPMSEDVVSSDKPIMRVLELKAGAAQKYNIKIGDKVEYE